MIWVFVFGGIAVLGLVMLVSYAIWLWHKASDVMAEVTVVLDRLGQLGDLAAQIRLPDNLGGPYPVIRSDEGYDDEWDEEAATASDEDPDDNPDDDVVAIATAARHARRARVGD